MVGMLIAVTSRHRVSWQNLLLITQYTRVLDCLAVYDHRMYFSHKRCLTFSQISGNQFRSAPDISNDDQLFRLENFSKDGLAIHTRREEILLNAISGMHKPQVEQFQISGLLFSMHGKHNLYTYTGSPSPQVSISF